MTVYPPEDGPDCRATCGRCAGNATAVIEPGGTARPADALRRALTELSGRERAALAHHCTTAAERWTPLLPRVAAVWQAMAEVVAEVDQQQAARAAAEANGRPTMRHARRQRI